jgi:hypothetical protein
MATFSCCLIQSQKYEYIDCSFSVLSYTTNIFLFELPSTLKCATGSIPSGSTIEAWFWTLCSVSVQLGTFFQPRKSWIARRAQRSYTGICHGSRNYIALLKLFSKNWDFMICKAPCSYSDWWIISTQLLSLHACNSATSCTCFQHHLCSSWL